MSDILILTSYGDIHAASVSWALSKLGQPSKLWFGSEFPVKQSASMRVGRAGLTKFSISDDSNIITELNSAKAIWHRRPSSPVLPKEMHESDKPAAMRECTRFVDAMTAELPRGAFWVNNKENAAQANHKPHQLIEAVKCGLTIPDTLFSNDPKEIRDFFHQNNGNIIYKAFLQPHWNATPEDPMEAKKVFTFFTSAFPEAALEEVFSLSSVPGIYQPRVRKAFEIRLTLMGDCAFAVKIDSQSDPRAALDWRQDIALHCKLSPFELPGKVLAGCKRLMKQLGLVFGCIDLIVTPDGEFIFLEVNQMGQFLWLEAHVPEFRMLETFAKLLMSCDPDFDDGLPFIGTSFGAFLESPEYAHFLHERNTTKPVRSLAVDE